MKIKRVFVACVVAAITLGVGGLDAAQSQGKVKKKSSRAAADLGAAGAIAGPARLRSRALAIDDTDANGVFCSLTLPNVHYLGTLPPNTGVRIDFENFDESDPIAVLSTIKMEGSSVGAENISSDDEGGELNPRFEIRRSYWATYVLTVGTADDSETCYAYRFRVVP
jgi:hypothetical protein